MTREVNDHENGYNEKLRGEQNLLAAQINDEKQVTLGEKEDLMFYIKNKKGELTNVEKMQQALLLHFKQAIEQEKSKLIVHANESKSSDKVRLEDARLKCAIGMDSDAQKSHEASKSALKAEMDEMRRQFALEQE